MSVRCRGKRILAFALGVCMLFSLFCINIGAYSVMTDKNVFRHHENDCMKIALTFDDGPSGKYTADILDYLKEENVHATFFVVGTQVSLFPELLIREEMEGHEIGNHTDTHPRLSGTAYSICDRCKKHFSGARLVSVPDESLCSCGTACSCSALEDEIIRCEDLVYELTEKKTSLFRPPEGYCTEEISTIASTMDYRIILWNIDTRDWDDAMAADIAEHILNTVQSGDIILFHDSVSRKDSQTLDALKMVIPVLKARGYRFVTVSELIDTES